MATNIPEGTQNLLHGAQPRALSRPPTSPRLNAMACTSGTVTHGRRAFSSNHRCLADRVSIEEMKSYSGVNSIDHTHMLTHTLTHMHKCMLAHTQTCSYTCLHIHTHAHTCAFTTLTYAHTRTGTHTWPDTGYKGAHLAVSPSTLGFLSWDSSSVSS